MGRSAQGGRAVIVGVVFALVTTVTYNSSFVLQKRALAGLPALEVRLPLRLARSLLTSPGWLLGFGLMLTGLGTQLVALSHVPLTIAQPVFSSGIAFLLVLTTTVLGERLTGREALGVAAIAGGVICVVLSLDSRTDIVGTGGRLGGVLAVALPSMAVGLMLFGLAHRVPGDLLYGLTSGIVYGVVGLVTKGLSASIDYRSAASMARSTLTSPYLYLVGGLTVVGLVVFQSGLQRCRASLFIPVCSVVSTLYTITAGTLLFGERLPGDVLRLALRSFGLVTILAGLVWLPLSKPAAGEQVMGEPSRSGGDLAATPRATQASEPPATG